MFPAAKLPRGWTGALVERGPSGHGMSWARSPGRGTRGVPSPRAQREREEIARGPTWRSGPPKRVRLGKDGAWTFEDKQAATPVVRGSLEEVVARVKEKQARLPAQPVVVSAGGNARYEDVIKVLDRLQMSGVNKVGRVRVRKTT